MKASLCPTRSASHFRVPAGSIHHVLLFTFVSVTTLSHLVFLLCFFLPVSLSSFLPPPPPRPSPPLPAVLGEVGRHARGRDAVTDASRSRVLSWILKRQTSAGRERDGNTMQLYAALADHRRHGAEKWRSRSPQKSAEAIPTPAGTPRRAGARPACPRASARRDALIGIVMAH